MVLKKALFIALLAGACVHKAPPQRLAQMAPVTTALVVDRRDGGGIDAMPQEVDDRVARELSSRNLEERPLDAASALGGTRNTQQRLALLAKAGDAPYVLLLETRVAYYDVLQGRFRWVVYGRATIARKDDLPGAATSEFELPVFLLYEHEKEPEALKAAAGALADRTGALLDNFLAAPAPAPKSGALYFILIDRFASAGDASDPEAFHGGTLQGVIDHLDDLASLGATAVWLSPLAKMRTEKFFGHGAFHGYWTEDLGAVEPRFGDARTLRTLVDAAHARGIRVYLDMVLNHVAPDSALTREHPEWFHHEGSITDWNDPAQYETHDVSGLPDLAQEKPEVAAYLIDAASKWLPFADGFRLDAVKHVPLQFWAQFDREMHARKPGLQLLGEALDGDPAKLARIERDGGFDALFDFPVAFALTDVFCKAQPAAHLGAVLSLDRLYDDASRLVTLVDDHDLPRIAASCGGDLEKVREALLVQMALRGTPMVSYGTESALRDPRGDMQWREQPLRPWIAKLLALRRAHPALDHGAQRIVALDGGTLLLARVAPEETVVIAIHGKSAGEPLATAGDCGLYVAAMPQTRPGAREVVFDAPVVGAGPELGAWDPAHAVTGAVKLPTDTIAEFKLVRRRPDGSTEWEPGANRFLFISEGDGPLRAGDLKWPPSS